MYDYFHSPDGYKLASRQILTEATMTSEALMAIAEQRLVESWNSVCPKSELMIPNEKAERDLGAMNTAIPWLDILKLLLQLAMTLLPLCLAFAKRNNAYLTMMAKNRPLWYMARACLQVRSNLISLKGPGAYYLWHGREMTDALLGAIAKSQELELVQFSQDNEI